MENYQKIELYQRRQFGDKLNAAFAFLRQNAGPFLKAQLVISGPVALAATALYTLLLRGLTQSTNIGTPEFILSSQYLSTIGLTLIIYFLLGISIYLVTYSYVKLYQENNGAKPMVGDVFRTAISKLGYGILAMLLIYLIVITSAFLFFFPAIYFGVICTLILPIMVLEDVSPITALQRAFFLIKGKWWSTFGLILVTGIVAYIIMLVLVLPFSLSSIISGLLREDDMNGMVLGNSWSWMMVVTNLLTYIGQIIGGSIVMLGIVFQYGNLIEMKESKGLMREIEEIGNEETPSANEGEY